MDLEKGTGHESDGLTGTCRSGKYIRDQMSLVPVHLGVLS